MKLGAGDSRALGWGVVPGGSGPGGRRSGRCGEGADPGEDLAEQVVVWWQAQDQRAGDERPRANEAVVVVPAQLAAIKPRA